MSRHKPGAHAYKPPERKLGTPKQEAWRKRCWQLFVQMCDAKGWSRTVGRKWLAEKMDIEDRYMIIYEMDETELITVAGLCTDGKM